MTKPIQDEFTDFALSRQCKYQLCVQQEPNYSTCVKPAEMVLHYPSNKVEMQENCRRKKPVFRFAFCIRHH